MTKKRIRLSESDLHKIVKKSVNRILKEASYDSHGNFDPKSHNNDLEASLKKEIQRFYACVDSTVNTLGGYEAASTDENFKERVREIINELLKIGDGWGI